MLAVILKILSIIGIILLILLCIALVLLLIVLFMPIEYRIDGSFMESGKTVKAKFRWLFGLLRGSYAYPEQGRFVVKLLWFTLFDSANPKPVSQNKSDTVEQTKKPQDNALQTNKEEEQHEPDLEETETGNAEVQDEPPKQTWKEKLPAKYEKIKYTIRKLYDKIKNVLENIAFYKELLQEESSRALMRHTLRRVGKLLQHIRPRKLETDIVFGTGSPDTTGYLYGIYGMLSPSLGKNAYVEPDFSQQIFRGTLLAKGYINIWTLLVNILAVALDKRLHSLLKKVKSHHTTNKEYRDKQINVV
jgi:hypothetical protein